jgi:hypothetical protein
MRVQLLPIRGRSDCVARRAAKPLNQNAYVLTVGPHGLSYLQLDCLFGSLCRLVVTVT